MKKGSLFLLFGTLVALYSLLSCQKKNCEPSPVWPEQVIRAAEISQVIGWQLFRQEQLSKPGQNVLLSPYSIQTAFSMALNGASGQTQEELQDFLGCRGCRPDTINTQHRYLNAFLTSHSGHPTLTVANRYFYDNKRIAVKASFLQTLEQYYQSGADALDFSAEQTALKHINGWVSHSTKGKIDRILDRITPLDVAFLINALHFKADWAKGFAPELTQKSAFTRPDGSEVQVDFVNADRDYFFAATQQFNLIDIPFRDSTYSLSLLQAAATNTDAQWHLNLTPSTWRILYDSLQYGRAHVFFPKLQLTYENDLIRSMEAIGVKAPFSEREADFSLMGTSSTGKRIFINQVKHKVVLNVDEKGAEGAAVTSIGFGIDSMPPTFWFNKPFVLVLRHIPTNTILFLGYVADPTA